MFTAIRRASSRVSIRPQRGIAGVYNRAVNGKERREALDQWDKHIAALVAKPKAKAGPKASPKPLKAAA
jgi:hypothetical protein